MLSTAGCGTKPYDLSSEEQEKVAAYAAHVVTRYNDRQDAAGGFFRRHGGF